MSGAGSPAVPAAGSTPGEVLDRLRAAGCVWAEEEAGLLLAEFTGTALGVAVQRRVAGEPLEHVLGWARFCGLRIAVRPPVFVPRVRAEPLARAAVAEVLSRPGPTVVLDLGCGSGAIAATVAAAAGRGADVWATDVSAAAVSCARHTAVTHGFRVVHGDWFAGLPATVGGRLDVVVAYLPHVPDARLTDVPADHRAAEQDVAVRGGPDGLDPLRTVLGHLDRWLAPGGVLLTLVAREQLEDARAVAHRAGWTTALVPAADQPQEVDETDETDGADGIDEEDEADPVFSLRRPLSLRDR